MPKGDGQGGNNTKAIGRPASEVSPWLIRFRQLELHRDCAAGKEPSSEPEEYHAEMVEKICAELTELAERSGGWMLEAMEGGARLLEAMGEDPRELVFDDIGLPERITAPLEARGMIFVGELCGLTRESLLQIPNVGEKSVALIEKALASVGLSLKPSEQAPPLPRFTPPPDLPELTVNMPSRSKADNSGAPERRRRIILALASGATDREANARAGMSPNAHRAVSDTKAIIRQRLATGESPRALAQWFGFSPNTDDSRLAIGYFRSEQSRVAAKPS